MSLELAQPQTLDKIDSEILSILETAKPDRRELFYENDIGLLPIYDELARIASVNRTSGDWEMVGRSSVVSRGDSQVIGRGWHRDVVSGYMTTNVLPTEFLLAEDEVVRNFWKKRKGAWGYPLLHDYITPNMARDISQQANSLRTEQLEDEYGFRIWCPEPLDVVVVGPTDIHRSTPNPEIAGIQRNFAMIYKYLGDNNS